MFSSAEQNFVMLQKQESFAPRNADEKQFIVSQAIRIEVFTLYN
jgi:hypothetical protein